jgi:hypothetical protein
MIWVSKEPPVKVCEGDLWYNEKDKLLYTADVEKSLWHEKEFDKKIPFTKKNKNYGS